MDNFTFNDQPDAIRLAFEISTMETHIDPELVLQFHHFQQAYRRMQQAYDHVLADADLSESRFLILMLLDQAPRQRLLPSEIADMLGSTRVTVTKLLNRMVAAHLVEKQALPSDKRKRRIHLTVAGKKRVDAFLPKHFAAVQSLLGEFTQEELVTLHQLLQKIEGGTQNLTNINDDVGG